jgi:hypothetical protein
MPIIEHNAFVRPQEVQETLDNHMIVRRAIEHINKALNYRISQGTEHEVAHLILGVHGFTPYNGTMDVELFAIGIQRVIRAINKYADENPDGRSGITNAFPKDQLFEIFKHAIDDVFEEYKIPQNKLRLYLWTESLANGYSTKEVKYPFGSTPKDILLYMNAFSDERHKREIEEVTDEEWNTFSTTVTHSGINGKVSASFHVDDKNKVTVNCNILENVFGEKLEAFNKPPQEVIEGVFEVVLTSLMRYRDNISSAPPSIRAHTYLENMVVSELFDETLINLSDLSENNMPTRHSYRY